MFVKLLEDAFDGARVGDVPGRCEGLTARLGDEADRGFRAFRHDVVDRDPHAFACEQLGGGLADALSGSCQPRHAGPPNADRDAPHRVL